MTETSKEFRYGDNKTIHGTQHVDVEVDHKGNVVSVWFRCMSLPFAQHVVPASRAQEMRTMYQGGVKHSITAIVFADGSNG